MTTEIVVKILTHDDAPEVPEGLYGVMAEMPSERSATGRVYGACLVESLDQIDAGYTRALAHSLADYNGERDRLDEYTSVIESRLQEACAGAA